VHDSVRSWAASIVWGFGLAELPTLEVGSLDVNGGVRGLFTGEYVGIDMRPGPGVDIEMNAHALGFVDDRFDVVVCTEVLEHDPAFWQTLAEIGRVLRPGGHLILTTRGNGFMLHEFPGDLWRFMPDSGEVLAVLASCECIESIADPQAPGIFVHGVRA